MLKLTEFMVLKTENISWRCLWKSAKRKSRFTRIFLFQSLSQPKKRDTKLRSNFKYVRKRLKT